VLDPTSAVGDGERALTYSSFAKNCFLKVNELTKLRPSDVMKSVLGLLVLLVWFSAWATAGAEVRLPNGEYTETNQDLTVKVLGGYVTIARTWTNGRWYVNPSWADLKFTYDSVDESVKAIDRAGSIYQRSGNGIYIFDTRFFVKATDSGWRWYDQRGNWITYDPQGHLTAYGDRNNVHVSFQLDANGNHTQILDHLGNPVLSFQYTGGKLTGVTDRAGRQIRYQYTGSNLTQVTDVLGNLWTYVYDANGQPTSRTNPEGHTTTIAYSPSVPAGAGVITGVESTGPTLPDYKIAPVFTITDPEGNATSYQYVYDPSLQQYSITQAFPSGRRVISVYYSDGRLAQQTVGSRVVYTMTRDGDLIEMVANERGLVTRTVYDSARNPLQITYPDGTSVSATYDSVYSNPLTKTDEVGTLTNYQYDSTGNLLTMTEAVGLPEQRVTTYTYDQYGERLTMTRKTTTSANDAITSYTYDAFGNVATVTDPAGNLTAATYDVMGDAVAIKDPRGNNWVQTYNAKGWLLTQTDPLNHGTTFAYDSVGNQATTVDALGNTTKFATNKNNWPTSVTDPFNGVTQYQHDQEGNLTSVVDPNGVTTTYSYDADERPLKVTDGNGNVIQFIYGDNSNGLNGLVAAIVFPTYTEQYKYDAKNRVVQTTQVLDIATRLVTARGYDGKGDLVSRTDALGRTTLYTYNAFSRMTTRTSATGGLTQYSHDSHDNLVSITDPNGGTTSYAYDLADRLVLEARPLGGTTRYNYDPAGNLTIRANAKGEQRQFAYDPANRRTTELQFGTTSGTLNASPSRTIVFSYDERNLVTGYDDGTTSATYNYDAKREKLSETVNFGFFSKTIQYGYRANGNRDSFTYPDNTQITYSYDANNQLTAIVTPQGAITYGSYRWQVPTTVTLPGITRTNSYDAVLRPTEIKVQANGSGVAGNPQGPVLMDYLYSYDAAGNIVQRATADGNYVYQYDALKRLTVAVPPASLQASPANPNGLPVEGYSYDAADNRVASQHQPGPWRYDADNKLLGYGQGQDQVNIQYDVDGHTVQKSSSGQSLLFKYDTAERLTQVTDALGSSIAAYYYDPFGRRLEKTVGGVTTYFQYADEGLVAEYDGGGNLTRSYGWSPNVNWGTNPQFLRAAGTIYFYHNDLLGTPQQLTDASGIPTWGAKVEAFGKTLVDATATRDNPLRFPGQYYDAETALHYNYFRDYDPGSGRYFETDPMGLTGGADQIADPISTDSRARFYIAAMGRLISADFTGFTAGVNLYHYVYNNPLSGADPFGLYPGRWLRCITVAGKIVCFVWIGEGPPPPPPEPTPVETPIPGPPTPPSGEPPPDEPVPIPSPSFCPLPGGPPILSPFPVANPIQPPILSPFPVTNPIQPPILSPFPGGNPNRPPILSPFPWGIAYWNRPHP
jgi:RHS repeat-associated protein